MLSIKAIRNAEYYLALHAEDYYFNGGEPVGRWIGAGARHLGLVGKVEPDQLRKAIEGYAPDGRKLVQNAGAWDRQGGWDLTFSAPKTVSVLWANSPEHVQRKIQELHFLAIQAALDYLERHVAHTRVGAGGVTRVPADMVASCFEHGTSRSHDPQVHSHLVVINVGVTAGGSTGALHSKDLYRAKMRAGAIYRMQLAHGLRTELGLSLRQERSWFEVEGVPQELTETLSKRRKQVVERLGEMGYETAAAAAIATLRTRGKKVVAPPRQELFAMWREECLEHGFSQADAVALIGQPAAQPDYRELARSALAQAIKTLEQKHSYFSDKELFLESIYAVQAIGADATKFLRALELEKAFSRSLITLGMRDDQVFYTTPRNAAIERRVLDSAERLSRRSTASLPVASLDRLLKRPLRVPGDTGRTITLRTEQANAVRYLASGESALRVVSGLAGTGKTAMLLAAREAFEKHGYIVIGVTPTHRARQELSKGAGIDTDTIAMRLRQFESAEKIPQRKTTLTRRKKRDRKGKGRPSHLRKLAKPVYLDNKSVVVLDEASMVDSLTFSKLLPHIERSGTRLLVVGDERQLPPIGPGGFFDKLVAQPDIGRLAYITRQNEELDRELVFQLSQGIPYDFLRQHALNGSLSLHEYRSEADRKLIHDWRTRGGVDEPHRHIIAAATNAQVDRFNDLAQQQRLAAGQLDANRSLQVGEERLYLGDRVTFQRNDRNLQIYNGDLGTVVAIRDLGFSQAIAVRLDGVEPTLTQKMKQKLWHDAEQFWKASQKQRTEAYVDQETRLRVIPVRSLWADTYQDIRRAYAFTTHKLQGASVDHVYVSLGEGMTDRELTYVQGSRHRESLKLYATREAAGEVLSHLAEHPLTSTEMEKKQPLDSPLAELMEKSRKREMATELHIELQQPHQPQANEISH